jgi:hypothetical protein
MDEKRKQELENVSAANYTEHLFAIMVDCFREAQKTVGEFGIRFCDYPGDLQNGMLHVYKGIEKLAELFGEEITREEFGRDYFRKSMTHRGIEYFELEDRDGNSD